MTLSELLKQARQLAAEGHVDAKDVEHLAHTVAATVNAVSKHERALAGYAQDEEWMRLRLDGTPHAFDAWNGAWVRLKDSLAGRVLLAEAENLNRLAALRLVAIGTSRKHRADAKGARA